MDEFEVTLAIINYNTKEWLDDCLQSILKAPPLAAHEIYVVDNASTDGSVDFVAREYPDVHIIENAGNLGFSAAANQALRTSHAPYVFILNTDTMVDEEAIDILVEFADAHDDLAVAGPLLLNTDGTVQLSGRRFPSFLDAMMHAFLGIIWPSNPFSVRYQMLDWDRTSERTVDWVSGAAMFIRRDAAREVDLFDDRYFMYVEDMDFCYRLWRQEARPKTPLAGQDWEQRPKAPDARQTNDEERERMGDYVTEPRRRITQQTGLSGVAQGWKVYFCPDAKVIHHIAKSSEQSSAKMIIEFQRSLYRFFAKNYSHTWKIFLTPLVAVGLALRGGILIAVDWGKRKLAKRGQETTLHNTDSDGED